ncbi:vascular cell adhesion protein 1-like [Rhincodon typus]|uniref:vascular cell adhesion protein 1-like n=1 Tax=Rhincodon typus TaxID=259920 RepID=UPI0009A2FFEE|nr:vascular cell adhesion protein 1-like [Rhincodon typus]
MAAGSSHPYRLLTLKFLLTTVCSFQIQMQPESLPWIRVGQELVLRCESKDCPSPSFVWRTGIDKPLGGTVSSQGSVSTLTFSPVTRQNENTFICYVTCGEQKKQKSRAVNVYSFPDALILETVGTLEVGRKSTVSCTVPDVYPPGRMEVKLLKGETVLAEKQHFGEESITLSTELIPSLRDSGQEITCQAQLYIQELSKSLEDKLMLHVQYAPRMTQISVTPSATVREGQDLQLICTAESKPPASFVWSKLLAQGWSIIARNESTLQLPRAQLTDSGTYRCEASNGLGQEARQLEIHVLAEPRDTHLSISPSVVKEGQRVTVTCTSHSNPSAQIILSKKTESGQIKLDSKNGTFIIDAAHSSDEGQYECEARNDLGTQIRNTELVVQVLTLWVHPSNLVSEGENVTIGCTVHSNFSANFTWKKMENNSETILLSTNNSFSILQITQSDAGYYEVEVINELGSQTGFVTIQVNETKLYEKPRGILETAYVGASLGSAGLLLFSTMYYIYRRNNCKGSYKMPTEQI